jgi:hypothetical protein
VTTLTFKKVQGERVAKKIFFFLGRPGKISSKKTRISLRSFRKTFAVFFKQSTGFLHDK